MKKYLLILIITLLFLISCNKQDIVELTVWGPQEEQQLLAAMVESFKDENPAKQFDIKLEVVGENDAKAKVFANPEKAGDIFAFANDQLKDFVSEGLLYEIQRPSDLKYINDNISKFATESASLNGKLYGYPESTDNGYFLYYNTSILSLEDVKDLDVMLAVAQAHGKKIYMDVSNGWYIASFFLGNNCSLSMNESGKTTCDFNNANGLQAALGIQRVVASPAFLTGDDTVLANGMKDGSVIACVSGTWNAEMIKASWKEHYQATKLPVYTLGNGEKVQMASFGGTKILGVNAKSKHPTEAMDLALFLIGEQRQVRRFEVRGIGPSNIKVSRSDEVRKNIALAALVYQSQFAFSQKNVPGSYWAPSEEFGLKLETDPDINLQEALDKMVAEILANN